MDRGKVDFEQHRFLQHNHSLQLGDPPTCWNHLGSWSPMLLLALQEDGLFEPARVVDSSLCLVGGGDCIWSHLLPFVCPGHLWVSFRLVWLYHCRSLYASGSYLALFRRVSEGSLFQEQKGVVVRNGNHSHDVCDWALPAHRYGERPLARLISCVRDRSRSSCRVHHRPVVMGRQAHTIDCPDSA